MNNGFNYETLAQLGEEGRILEYLMTIPRERWADCTNHGSTLLHFACRGPNVEAVKMLIQSRMVDVEARTNGGWTPVHVAASFSQPEILEILCASKANLHEKTLSDHSAIDFPLRERYVTDREKTIRVLIANGVWLNNATGDRQYITQSMVNFEKAVRRCRSVTLGMLCVKRAAGLWHVDRFVFREIGFAIWATRYDDEWVSDSLG